LETLLIRRDKQGLVSIVPKTVNSADVENPSKKARIE
jgi:hypothetical protein